MYRLTDLDFMREALRLAAEATALASPNPQVGAVVVRNGEIVGRGVHLYERQTHAEVLALTEAGERARGATLYLNLEPCCHHGRTPPCTEAVIASGVARVVTGMRDPNPRVSGQGLRQIEAAGIQVECGCLGREAQRLNEAFSKWIRTGLPWVTLKAAVSLDGRIAPATPPTPPGAAAAEAAPGILPLRATAERRPEDWISSQPARERVQQMRHACDAVLTGIDTVLADNPLLTDRTRLPRRRPLYRIVLDSHLRLPPGSALVRSARRQHGVIVFCLEGAAAPAQLALEKAGVEVRTVPATAGVDGVDRVDLEAVLRQLAAMDVLSVLLEAGSRMNAAMLAGGWVDKLVLFQAPRLLGSAAPPLVAGNGTAVWPHVQAPLSCERVGPDVMIEAYVSAETSAAGDGAEPVQS